MRLMFWVALVVLAIDQATKFLVVNILNLRSLGTMDVLPPFLNFRMAWNRGVNFGLFSNDADIMKWVLIAVAIGISIWVVLWLRHDGAGKWAMISGGFLIGGAAGNVLDRLIYGAVADFLNMSCCGIDNPFAFNVADIAIFAGALGLILFTGRKNAG